MIITKILLCIVVITALVLGSIFTGSAAQAPSVQTKDRFAVLAIGATFTFMHDRVLDRCALIVDGDIEPWSCRPGQ